MRLFLQIDLSPWQNSGYQKPLLTYASDLSSDLIGAEMDNQSDASIADILVKLCDQASLIFVLIQAAPDESFGSTLKVIHRLFQIDERISTVIISGTNQQVDRITSGFGKRVIRESDSEKIKEQIRAFALT